LAVIRKWHHQRLCTLNCLATAPVYSGDAAVAAGIAMHEVLQVANLPELLFRPVLTLFFVGQPCFSVR